jgi:hypothetical protein
MSFPYNLIVYLYTKILLTKNTPVCLPAMRLSAQISPCPSQDIEDAILILFIPLESIMTDNIRNSDGLH